MSYSKNTWETGDTITAEKLNHMEEELEELDSSAGTIALTATGGINGSGKKTLTFTETAAEIYAMCKSSRLFQISFAAGENVSVECVCAVQGIKNDVGGTVSYNFRVDTDKTYVCEAAAGTDVLVLTEV